jgi:hypothetical protein
VKLRSYQRVYASNVFEAAFNAIVFALAPIWIPAVAIYLTYAWFTQPAPFCVDVAREYSATVEGARQAYAAGNYATQLDREQDARKLKQQLDANKCRATPKAPQLK